jgi:aldehyde dehydrogenase (NAD+)
MEIGAVLDEIMQAYNGAAKWAKTESAPFSINFAAMKPVIRKEPKGTVLIISPFNFPLYLSLLPVVRIFIRDALDANN